MATSKEFMDSILQGLEKYEVSCRAMMGEYVVYCKGKVIGGVYDSRLLVKPTSSALKMLPNAEYQLPYEGAKPALYVENLEDKKFLGELLCAIADELPAAKKKK
ncbi:MAG: TfoX/Sxy family protein [Clostridia bacterium]|nr:TfoX/Sxy family protein [Clostridia bacterium]